MNIERLTKIAEWLEAGGKHETVRFDMRTGLTVAAESVEDIGTPACNTACCIAGAAVQFFNKEEVSRFPSGRTRLVRICAGVRRVRAHRASVDGRQGSGKRVA